jgi:exodeoxyribonuclease-5
MVEFSQDQLTVYDGVKNFLDSSTPGHVVYEGLAGTGKSTLMARLAGEYDQAVLCSYTAKAASGLRAKTGLEVFTIHQIIYDFKGLIDSDENPNKKRPVFSTKHMTGALENALLFIDEVSMVGSKIGRDLADTGARIVACGDPGQLPPVMDNQYFTQSDYTLHEVHRQAWDSPIIRQAHSIRNFGTYESDGDVIVTADMNDDLLGQHDIALCWKNKTRNWLNKRTRGLYGRPAGYMLAGEPVMCLKNDHWRKIYNGAMYNITQDYHPGDDLHIRDELNRYIVVACPTIEGIDPDYENFRYLDDARPFAPGYACTVHKAQGSEWGRVLLIDEYRQTDGRNAYLYTGLTRAISAATVIKRW